MNLHNVLEKYNIPSDALGTCPIKSLKEKHVSYLGDISLLDEVLEESGAYILVSHEFLSQAEKIVGNRYFAVEDPTQAFLEIHNSLYSELPAFTPGEFKPTCGSECEIDATARFGKNVVVGDRVRIHPHVVIGSDVEIGNDTVIFASASIYNRVHIGERCIIDACASIGGDGFRIIKDAKGDIHRLIHVGGVRFGNDVEFGNSSCVDRGSFGDTILEDRVKIDNLVHIGHNALIKENSLIAASSCIGGSTVIGRNCWIGIGAVISNGLEIEDGASILINAVVVRNVSAGERMSGFYAMPHKAWKLVNKDHSKRFVSETGKKNKD